MHYNSHTVTVKPLPITMARAKLWPATPTNPHFCFSFNLLDWVEALMLESQVSIKDFCKTVDFRCPFEALKVCCITENVKYNYYFIEKEFVCITDEFF